MMVFISLHLLNVLLVLLKQEQIGQFQILGFVQNIILLLLYPGCILLVLTVLLTILELFHSFSIINGI